MKKTIKAIALASLLVLPTFFAGNAFAISGCGKCVAGTAPASHATFGVTSTTLCTTCHTAPAIPATPAIPGKPTTSATPATPSTPGIALYRTTRSCGACLIATAPGSVSAHKNVNIKMTACAVCHSSESTAGIGESTGITAGKNSDDHGSARGIVRSQPDGRQSPPRNSDFGRDRKNSKQ